MSKYFIFITGDKYPAMDAGATRTHSFVKICAELGYEPIVIGMGEYTGNTYQTFEGIKYYSLRLKNKDILSRLIGRMLFPYFAKKLIFNFQPRYVKGIMLSSLSNRYFLAFIKKISLKYRIPVIYDSVEWYSPSEFKNGKNNSYFKANDNLNNHLIMPPLKVVAISRYLENHFVEKGVSVVRIPVILDVENITHTVKSVDASVIKIVYAGSPGNKDRLYELIAAVSQLSSEEQKRLHIRIIGIDKDTFIKKWWSNEIFSISQSIYFEGRQSREYVLKSLNNADFAFLLRPSEERYAKAGFPTKVAESLSCGTAMLCNYSSDLEMYLHDDENSIIISGCNIKDCLISLRKILNLSPDKIQDMKNCARITAEKNFNWKNHTETFNKLLTGGYEDEAASAFKNSLF